MSRLGERLILRTQLARMAACNEFTADELAKIAKVRRSHRLVKLLAGKVDSWIATQHTTQDAVPKGERPFLEWLWANRAAIMALIKQLLEELL